MEEDKIVNIKTIPKDKTIVLTVSGQFYGRIRSMISNKADELGEKKLSVIYKYISDGMSHHNQEAFHFETLLMLCKSIEEEFESNDLMLDESINIDEEIRKLEAEKAEDEAEDDDD